MSRQWSFGKTSAAIPSTVASLVPGISILLDRNNEVMTDIARTAPVATVTSGFMVVTVQAAAFGFCCFGIPHDSRCLASFEVRIYKRLYQLASTVAQVYALHVVAHCAPACATPALVF
jgi:hypothetical protein